MHAWIPSLSTWNYHNIVNQLRKWRYQSLSRVWLCDPMDCSPRGSSVHGILLTRILEGVAIPFSRGSSWPRDQTWISHNAGRFFTIWAIREAPMLIVNQLHIDSKKKKFKDSWISQSADTVSTLCSEMSSSIWPRAISIYLSIYLYIYIYIYIYIQTLVLGTRELKGHRVPCCQVILSFITKVFLRELLTLCRPRNSEIWRCQVLEHSGWYLMKLVELYRQGFNLGNLKLSISFCNYFLGIWPPTERCVNDTTIFSCQPIIKLGLSPSPFFTSSSQSCNSTIDHFSTLRECSEIFFQWKKYILSIYTNILQMLLIYICHR